MNKRKIVFAIGLFLLPIGQPIYLGSASIFSSPDAIYSLSAKRKQKMLSFIMSVDLRSQIKEFIKERYLITIKR